MELTGLFPNEFDRTTTAVLHTVQALGVTDEQIERDQEFLCDLMVTVGGISDDSTTEDTVAAMDCAFIGLLYHRHMPFIDSEDGATIHPARGATDYATTLTAVANGLISGFGVSPSHIQRAAEEGTVLATRNLRVPPSSKPEDIVLHTHVIALFVIGMLVHRLMPTTPHHPMEQ